MTYARPALACAVAGVLILTAGAGGCRRREAAAPSPAAPAQNGAAVTPADAGAPMNYESKNEFAEVRLTLPEAVRAHPDLHAQLYAASMRDLRQFTEGAQSDQTEFGGEAALVYSKSIAWNAGGETGKLASFYSTSNDFAGGAHGNMSFGAALWDKALKRIVEPAQLFRRGADLTALDQALCAAINAAKKGRDPAATPVSLGAQDGAACPRAADTPFVLEASRTPGKAGGLVFLLAPYLVGAYAEGTYEVVVPQSVFAGLLNPAYAGEFAGEPARSGDVTPKS